jgi:hypothetical protein
MSDQAGLRAVQELANLASGDLPSPQVGGGPDGRSLAASHGSSTDFNKAQDQMWKIDSIREAKSHGDAASNTPEAKSRMRWT